MKIADIWMTLESLAHLREMGPKYRALHDRLAKEIEEHSASLEAKSVQAPVSSPPRPSVPEAQQEEAEVRRQAAAASLAATAGPAVGNQPDDEPAPEHVERRV